MEGKRGRESSKTNYILDGWPRFHISIAKECIDLSVTNTDNSLTKKTKNNEIYDTTNGSTKETRYLTRK